MYRKIKAGATSQTAPIIVRDASSTSGAGLAGLAHNTAGLTAKYRRQGQSGWTSITLATATVGTYTSGGFIADSGVAVGHYEVGIPDAALAAGAEWVEIEYYGATNMLPTPLFIELDTIDYQAAGGKLPSTLDAGDVSGNLPVADSSGVTTLLSRVTAVVPTATEISNVVWSAGTRTLTSLGSLASDVATAVWSAATRTLTAFGFTPSLHPDYDAAKTAAPASAIAPLATTTGAATNTLAILTAVADCLQATDYSVPPTADAVATAVLRKKVEDVIAGLTAADIHTLAFAIQMLTKWQRVGNVIRVQKPDGSTWFDIPFNTDPDNDPIDSMG
jgi:hypothetical protein